MKCARAVALGAAIVLGVTPVVTAMPAASAAGDTPEVEIILDSLSPLVPRKNDNLHISGSIVNTSQESIDEVRVGLRKSSAPLSQATDVTAVIEEDITPTSGTPDDVELPGTYSSVSGRLAPGGRARFDITLPMSSLGFPSPGAYVVGIEAVGTTSATGQHRLNDLRTFVPWLPTGSVAPIDMVWLWPIADWPDRNAAGVLLNDRTPTELAPGGRLSRLVELGTRYDDLLTWVADPEVLQAAASMSKGYLVQRGTRTVPGEGEDNAATWLDDVSAATGDGAGMHVLPYADIDASAVTRAGLATDVVRSVTQAPAIAEQAVGHDVEGTVYWAPAGRLDRQALNVLASAGVRDVILSSAAMPASSATTGETNSTTSATASLPTSVGTMRAVLVDASLSALLSLPDDGAGNAITARQEFLARTALSAQAADTGDDQAGRRDPARATLVVAPESVRWDPESSLVGPLLRATRQAPWIKSVTFDELTDGTSGHRRTAYGAKARESELTIGYMDSVHRLSGRVDSFTSILDDPTGVSDPYAAALLRTESSAWRTQPQAAVGLVRSIGRELDAQVAQVRVLSSGTITLSGDTGKVPVTIANDLDRAVTVGLELVATPALRLTSTPLEDITIEPGKMTSVDIEARVVGGDPLPVNVQLTTPDGDAFGTPASIKVMSTAYSRAAAWVVAVAFLAIVIFVIVGVTRRIHAAGRSRS